MANKIQRCHKIKSIITKVIFILFIFTQHSLAGDIDFSVFLKGSDQEKRFLSNNETIPLNNQVQLQVYSKQSGILEIYYSSENTKRTNLLKDPIEVDVGDLIVLPSVDSYFPMDLEKGNVQFEFGFIGDSEKIIKIYNFFAHDLKTQDFSSLKDNPVTSQGYNASYIKNLTQNKPSASFSEKSDEIISSNLQNLTTLKLRGFENVFKKTAVATVAIIANGDTEEESYSGSGVYLKDGTIITNLHVIENTKEILIYPYNNVIDTNGNYISYVADILKVSTDKDLALLSIKEEIEDYLTLSKDCDTPVASDVHAVGHPAGHYWTYTKGYVSQIRPDYDWSYDGKTFMVAEVIQTQTPINPGNSGGPLVNSEAHLIGINSFTMPESPGINFAVSCNEIKSFLTKDNDFNGWDSVQVSKTNNSSEPEWSCFDTNKDEEDDYCTQDYNQNGEADTFSWDENYDGIYDYFAVDDNENGIPEYTVLISDGDNPYASEGYDIYYFDDDENKEIDKIGYDYDNDQKIDKYVDV